MVVKMNTNTILSLALSICSTLNVCVIIRILYEQRQWRKRTSDHLERLLAYSKMLDEHSKTLRDAYNEFRGDDWWRKE